MPLSKKMETELLLREATQFLILVRERMSHSSPYLQLIYFRFLVNFYIGCWPWWLALAHYSFDNHASLRKGF